MECFSSFVGDSSVSFRLQAAMMVLGSDGLGFESLGLSARKKRLVSDVIAKVHPPNATTQGENGLCPPCAEGHAQPIMGDGVLWFVTQEGVIFIQLAYFY